MRGLLLALAALAAATGCAGGTTDEPAVPLGRSLSATRSLTPTAHLFGDTVVAEVEVVVDRDRLDPGRIRLAAAFAPYEPTGATELERDDYSRYSRLRYRMTLRCLDVECLTGDVSPGITPAGEQPALRRAERIFRFPVAHVYYDEPAGRRPRHLLRIYWPRLEALSRVSPRDPSLTFFFVSPFRTTLNPLPSLSYGVSPTPLAVALLLGAALLLALPATLAAGWLRGRRRPVPEAEETRVLPPLERAVLLVEQTGANGNAQQRREALEVLAYELDLAGSAVLALQARRLGWSAGAPSAGDAAALTGSVRDAHVA